MRRVAVTRALPGDDPLARLRAAGIEVVVHGGDLPPTPEELRALAAEGLGIVLDIVPNHMGTGDENRWWPDPEVFDIDPESGWYRRFFDIDDLAAVRVRVRELMDIERSGPELSID